MSEKIKTKSFELAAYIRGNRHAKKLVIVLPGRLDTKDYAHTVAHVNYLARKGYLAVSFDPPGTWESQGGLNLYTTTNYIKAINEVIEYFGNKPTLLVGHSRGGAVAILAGAKNPNVNGLVLLMASYGYPTPPSRAEMKIGFHIEYRDYPSKRHGGQGRKMFKLPMAYFRDGRKYVPLRYLKECYKPKLMIFGKRDEFKPISKAKNICKSVPYPKTVKELNCGHEYWHSPQLLKKVNDIIGKFVDEYGL